MMSRHLLLPAVFVLCLMVQSILCEEGDEAEGQGLFSKFKTMVKNFMNSMRDIWSQFKGELKARTGDMADWTQEMWTSFKEKMSEWIDQMGNSASDKEKEDMRKYLEKMEMPEEKQ